MEPSRNDKISIPLESIVTWCTVRAICLMNNFLCYFYQLLICRCFMESFFHCCLIKFFKAFHSWTMGHHYNTLHDLLFILANEFKAEEEKKFKMFEDIWIVSFHKFHVIWCQFKWGFFKPHISRRGGNYKWIIDVNNMSMSIDENVVVMSVLYGEKILNYTVAS